MSTTPHITPSDISDLIAHLDADSTLIDESLEMLAAGGLRGWVVCDGTCSGLAGCTVAPLGPPPAVAA